MSRESLINSVRSFLASHSMFVEDEWLLGCVEYLTEDSSKNYSVTDIQNLAKEQWLLNDLKDICPGCLPPNLNNIQRTVLNGKFALQINSAVDIGTPAYQQYLKLQKVNMENVEATTNFEDKVPSHRMIKLYLTDGTQEVTAIEYKPMRNLRCDITPGCKMYLKGPVECRRGMILLTESSVELLGGEVEEITMSNSLAGVLSSKLGLPLPQECEQNISTRNNTNLLTAPTHIPQASPQQSHDLDDDIDVDQLAAIEAQFTDNPGKRQLDATEKNPEKKLKIDSNNVNKVDDFPDENDMFMEEDDDQLRLMEQNFDVAESELKVNTDLVTIPAEPFVYIKQINDMKESNRIGRVFRVKGQIIKLLSKLSVGKNGWSLRCTIVDGTGCIDADFTSDVLSNLVGLTPQEMQVIKKQMNTNPAMKDRALSVLQKAKNTLQVLYCIIELTILEVPKITALMPYDDTHGDLLKKRLQISGL